MKILKNKIEMTKHVKNKWLVVGDGSKYECIKLR